MCMTGQCPCVRGDYSSYGALIDPMPVPFSSGPYHYSGHGIIKTHVDLIVLAFSIPFGCFL